MLLKVGMYIPACTDYLLLYLEKFLLNIHCYEATHVLKLVGQGPACMYPQKVICTNLFIYFPILCNGTSKGFAQETGKNFA